MAANFVDSNHKNTHTHTRTIRRNYLHSLVFVFVCLLYTKSQKYPWNLMERMTEAENKIPFYLVAAATGWLC